MAQIALLTGAGMSAECGIPTFRDALTGLWARFDPEQLATEAAFRRDPALVWGWYRWRAAQVLRAAPHEGHRVIAALGAQGHRVDVITQNVDDLHERAGSERVVHLHGRLLQSRCLGCGATREPDPITAAPVPGDGERETPPDCADCGEPFRPGVVWFGEAMPDDDWRAAQEAIAGCDVLVVVGTSGIVQPAASLPALARAFGKRVLEINPGTSAITAIAHEHWRARASDGLVRLQQLLSG